MAYYTSALRAVLRAYWQLRAVDTVGSGIRMFGKAFVFNDGQIHIGNRVVIMRGSVPVELTTQNGGIIDIGTDTQINYGCIFLAVKKIKIGARCRFGYYATVLDCDMHRLEPERRHELPEPAAVTIEDDVWIGTRAIILPGVTIGQGSIVAAGSIVTKNVPPRTIVAGVPATIIRNLNDTEQSRKNDVTTINHVASQELPML